MTDQKPASGISAESTKAKTISAMHREDRDDPSSPVIGYMCLVDFQCELGAALGGNTVYPDAEDCRERRGCTDECGIIEVEIRCRRVVQPGNRWTAGY